MSTQSFQESVLNATISITHLAIVLIGLALFVIGILNILFFVTTAKVEATPFPVNKDFTKEKISTE